MLARQGLPDSQPASPREWAGRALAVYVERGSRALQELQDGNWDGAAQTLRLRTAAWFNFLAAEGLLQSDGKGLRQAFGDDTWARVLGLNAQLEAAIEVAQAKLEHELGDMVKTRRNLSRYRSNESDVSRFSGSV